MPDVTIASRDVAAFLKHLETVQMHHTKRLVDGVVVEASFPHDAESHLEAPDKCPQCSVLTSVFALRKMMTATEEAVGIKSKVVSISEEEHADLVSNAIPQVKRGSV